MMYTQRPEKRGCRKDFCIQFPDPLQLARAKNAYMKGEDEAMEANVFTYFVAIGAGTSFGLTIGAIPALVVWRWLKKRNPDDHLRSSRASR